MKAPHGDGSSVKFLWIHWLWRTLCVIFSRIWRARTPALPAKVDRAQKFHQGPCCCRCPSEHEDKGPASSVAALSADTFGAGKPVDKTTDLRVVDKMTRPDVCLPALSQQVEPILRKAGGQPPAQYATPIKRIRVNIKIQGFEPQDVSTDFSARLASAMAAQGKGVSQMTMWKGCIELSLELCAPVQLDDPVGGDDEDDRTSSSGAIQAATAAASAAAAAADGVDGSHMLQRSDAAVLQALLASVGVQFEAGQKVWAQVEGREYQIVCCGAVAEAPSWSIMRDVGGAAGSAVVPRVPQTAALQLQYSAPACVLLDDGVYRTPTHVKIAARGLGGAAAVLVRFAALVGGLHLPCAHNMTRGEAADVRQGDVALWQGHRPAGLRNGAPSQVSSLTWFDVEVPPLPRSAVHGPGLMTLQCREVAADTVPRVVGVLPVLLLDDPRMVQEVGQLQADAQRYCQQGAHDGLLSVRSLLVDLGQWLEWADGHQGVPVVAHSVWPPARSAPTVMSAMMGEVGRALLHAAVHNGWRHTTARILTTMQRLDIPLPDDLAGHLQQVGQAGRSHSTHSTHPGSTDEPLGAASLAPQGSVSTACDLSGLGCGEILHAMAFGFDTPGDEERYVNYVSTSYVPIVRSWLVCSWGLTCLWLRHQFTRGGLRNIVSTLIWNAPILATGALHFLARPVWQPRRELLWLVCVVFRTSSRLALMLGDAGTNVSARAFMEKYGDIVAGVILPQSAEWVRSRYLVGFQVVDLVVMAVVYRHLGLYERRLLPCCLHSLVKTCIGVAINAGVEFWTRRKFAQAMRRKRE